VLFELRQYRVRPGRRDEWVKLMDEVIIPFQAAKGMTIVGTFVAEEDPDLYVWIRRFEDETERERLYDAVYESEHWKTAIAPRTAELLGDERMVVTRLIPTDGSEVR
jgi:quinol monooxygenase YgiN